MNRLEYIRSLIKQDLSSDKITILMAEWDVQNPVKIDDTQTQDATAVSTNNEASATASESLDGSSTLAEEKVIGTREDGSEIILRPEEESSSVKPETNMYDYINNTFENLYQNNKSIEDPYNLRSDSSKTLSDLQIKVGGLETITEQNKQREKLNSIAGQGQTYENPDSNSTYKWDVGPNNEILYYSKDKDKDEWILATENEAIMGVAFNLGHTELTKEQYKDRQTKIKKNNELLKKLNSEVKQGEALPSSSWDKMLKNVDSDVANALANEIKWDLDPKGNVLYYSKKGNEKEWNLVDKDNENYVDIAFNLGHTDLTTEEYNNYQEEVIRNQDFLNPTENIEIAVGKYPDGSKLPNALRDTTEYVIAREFKTGLQLIGVTKAPETIVEMNLDEALAFRNEYPSGSGVTLKVKNENWFEEKQKKFNNLPITERIAAYAVQHKLNLANSFGSTEDPRMLKIKNLNTQINAAKIKLESLTDVDTGVSYLDNTVNSQRSIKRKNQIKKITQLEKQVENYEYHIKNGSESDEVLIDDHLISGDIRTKNIYGLLYNAYDMDGEDFKKLNINKEEFIDYLHSQGLAEQYYEDINNEDVNKYGGISQLDDFGAGAGWENNNPLYSDEDSVNLEIARERDLSTWLRGYLNQNQKNVNEKLMLSWMTKNTEKLEGKSLKEAFKIATQHFEDTHGQPGFATYNQTDVNSYTKENFQELEYSNSLKKERDKQEQDERLQSTNFEGLLMTLNQTNNQVFETLIKKGTNAYRGVQRLFNSDALQSDMLLDYEYDLGLPGATYYSFAEGKTATIEGVDYMQDKDGVIYNTTANVKLVSLSDKERIKIQKALDESTETGYDASLSGLTVQTGAVMTGLALDIAAMYATQGGSRLLGLTKFMPAGLSLQQANVMAYYGAVGYNSTYTDVFNQFRSEGYSDDVANGASTDAARMSAVWYAGSSIFAPNIKYLQTVEKRLGVKGAFGNSVAVYKNGGATALTKSWNKRFNDIMLKPEASLTRLRNGLEEAIQENVQGLGDIVINKNINKNYGTDILNEEITVSQLLETTILSIGAGGSLANVTTGSNSNAKQNIADLNLLSKDIPKTENLLKTMVVNGDITQELSDKFLSDLTSVKNQIAHVPSYIPAENVLESVNLLEEIKNLENDKKQLEKNFHKTIDDKLKIANDKLQEIDNAALAKTAEKNIGAVEQDIENVEGVVGKDNIVVLDSKDAWVATLKKLKVDGGDTADGMFFESDGKIYINKQRAAEVGAVTVAKHELFHKVTESLFNDPIKGQALVDRFKSTLGTTEMALLQKRIDDNYKYKRDSNGTIQLDENGEAITNDESTYVKEWFTSFSDLVGKNKIGFTDNLGNNLLRFAKEYLIPKGWKPKGFINAEFSTGRQVYDWIKDYNKSVNKGKGLDVQSAKLIKEPVTESDSVDFSKTEAVDNRNTELITKFKSGNDQKILELNKIKTKLEDQGKSTTKIDNEIKEFKNLDIDASVLPELNKNNIGLIKKFENQFDSKKGGDVDGARQEVRNQIEKLYKTYKPTIDGKPNPVKFGGYAMPIMQARMAAIYDKFSVKFKNNVSLDSKEAQKIENDGDTSKAVVDKIGKKPSETTGLDKATETAIDKAVDKVYKGKEIGFPETKNIPQEVADIYGEMFGLNPETIVSKKRNYQKTDAEGLTRAKQFLLKNAKSDYNRLPKTKNDLGKGTFVPQNVKDALYTDGELTGSLKDYIDLIRKKPIKPIYRDSVGQTIRGLLNLHIRNRILETTTSQPKRLQSGALFSLSYIEGMFDRRLKGKLKVDTLLTEAELKKSLDLKKLVLTEGGREQIVKTFKEEVFVLLPKLAWLQKDAFTSSNANFNISIKNGTKEEVAAFNQLKEDLNKEIRNTPDKEFGKPITYKDENGKTQTLTNFALSTYGTIFKGTPGEIKSKSEKFNIKTGAIHKALWDRIAARIKKDKKRAPAIATYLKLTANDKSSWHRKGAQIFGYSQNPKGVVNSKGVLIFYEMEHAMPATAAYLYLLDNAIKNAGKVESSFKEAYELVVKNYKLIALDKAQNAKLGLAKLDSTMPNNWNLLKNFWWQRYFNEDITKFDGGIDPSSIVGLDGKSFADTFKIQADGQTTTEPLIKESKKAVKLNNKNFGKKTSFSKTVVGQINALTKIDNDAAKDRKNNLNTKQRTFDKIFNNIIEDSTGIKSYKEYSPAKAQTVGANKGKFTFFTTPSAEDFLGLMYKLLGKGKVGDAQMAFIKTNIIDPYNKAEVTVTKAKISAANDYKALKRKLTKLPRSLSKATGIGGFTFGQAARVAIWTKQGMEVPGLSKKDAKELNAFVKANTELDVFVNELMKIQKGKPYPKPGKSWLAGTIPSDIETEINKVNRAEYMQEFNENVDIIFSDKNMAKLEAAYGPRYVEALRDQLRRMKSGSNRPIGGSRIVNNLLDWLNNSVGAIMFLNTRSAVLQTISAVNFINFGDNNIYKAGKAFANQKQYWKDFMTLFNSPYLLDRRDGLKINVSESEISDAVSESTNKPKAFLSLLLSKGFVMTRIADSFAIASGGSTFFRNRIEALVDSGMEVKDAEKQAFQDFYDTAETSQQSSNAAKISQQQASGAGRVILAFANTPMQYTRIIKRSTQDLINGRGDWKTNVSKIVYYGAIQNLIFNALQTALFALAFGDDDDEEKQAKLDEKSIRIINGMSDSLFRGFGIQGAIATVLKDAIVTIYKEVTKEKGSPDFEKAIYDLFGFSPPLDSKIRKLRSGANTFSWEQERMDEEGSSLNNPAYLATAQVISSLTNVPLDRAIQKINNLRAIFSNSSQNWQKLALAMGWSTWDLGLPYYGVNDKVEMTPQMILKEKVTTMAKETSTKDQKQILLDLGLTKQEIIKLKYEDVRIKKIIELQNKKKDE